MVPRADDGESAIAVPRAEVGASAAVVPRDGDEDEHGNRMSDLFAVASAYIEALLKMNDRLPPVRALLFSNSSTSAKADSSSQPHTGERQVGLIEFEVCGPEVGHGHAEHGHGHGFYRPEHDGSYFEPGRLYTGEAASNSTSPTVPRIRLRRPCLEFDFADRASSSTLPTVPRVRLRRPCLEFDFADRASTSMPPTVSRLRFRRLCRTSISPTSTSRSGRPEL